MKQDLPTGFLKLIKYLCIAFIITMILLAILAFLLWKFEVGDNMIHGGIIFSYIFSCFIGGLFLAGEKKERCFMWGALLGFVYYLIVAGISMILNKQLFPVIPGMISVFFLCVFGGMMGGMVRSGNRRL